MKLYFVRHGQSEANVLQVFSNRGWQHGLTAAGRAQVKELGNTLSCAGAARIYSSPLKRAMETASILGRRLGVGYEAVDALREYDCGVLEGAGGRDAARIYAEVLDDWVERYLWNRRIEGGESFNDIRRRFVPFVEALVDRPPEHQANSLLVAHGGVLRCMLPLVLANVDLEFSMSNRLGYAATVTAHAQPDRLVCLDWAGTPPPTARSAP
jgi:probable phosphoglycerate mutase